MNIADYIIKFYEKKGIDYAFVVYGAANGDLIDAFTRSKKIKYISTINEQGAGFAAEGYFKEKKIPGLSIVTSGPGATNLVTNVASCYYESVPNIFLTGQVNSNYMRPNNKIRQIGFQETDIVNIVKPISKYSKLLLNPNEIDYELKKSFQIACSGRPGPILLDIPLNIQKMAYVKSKQKKYIKNNKQKFNEKHIRLKIRNFLDDFKKSKRPSFLIGGGLHIVKKINITKLHKIVKKLKIPCFVTWNAIDVFSHDDHYYAGRVGTYGGPGRNLGLQNCDLLFGIGTRISGRITGGNPNSFAREAKKYVIDIDKNLINPKYQEFKVDVNIYSDLELFLDIFLKEINNSNIKFSKDRSNWIKKTNYWKKKYDTYNSKFSKKNGYTFGGKNYVHPYYFTRRLSNFLKKEDTISIDLGGTSVIFAHSYQTKFGQRTHSNNSHAGMGYALPAIIGSYFGAQNKRKNFISISGDGGFCMNIQELQTIKNYNLPIKNFVINNSIYGITKAFQKTNFGGREEACGPKGYSPPDFCKVGKGFQIKVFNISSNTDVDKVLKKIFKYKGPIICNINCKEFHKYEPKLIGWNTPIEDMYPYLSRDELSKNLFIKKHNTFNNPFMPDVVGGME